jgi:hypothetical protein
VGATRYNRAITTTTTTTAEDRLLVLPHDVQQLHDLEGKMEGGHKDGEEGGCSSKEG